MIISNILGDQIISDKAGQFYKVADSTEEYAEMIEPICLKGDGRGGSDHFISTIRSINALWKNYSYYGIDETLDKIKETSSLLMWFSMVVTAMLYGCNTGNNFTPVSLPIDSNRPYLKVWKNKLSISDKYDNCVGEEDDVTEESLNVYYFDRTVSSSIAGCCSRKFFIIPSREVTKRSGEYSPWKDFYHKLIDVPGDLNRNLFLRTSQLQKILLLLSAKSLPDDSPLKIIKDIIFAYVNVPLHGFDDLPAKELGNISLYCVDNNHMPFSMYSDKIYFVYSNEFLHALYPFNPTVLDEIEKGNCIVKNLTMRVSESTDLESEISRIDMVTVTGAFVFNITFTGSSGKSVAVPFHFTETHDFTTRSVGYLSELPTFCMYPDIPLEYESLCRMYTFFSNRASRLKSYDYISKFTNSVDLSEQGIACYSEISDTSIETSNGSLYTFDISTVEKPKHLIKVVGNNGLYLGTVVNLRRKDGEPCSVLFDENSKVEINLAKQENLSEIDMSVYVDFGNNTCSMGYKVSFGEPYFDSITGGTPTIRCLLSEYDFNSYEPYMNISKSTINCNNVPSYMVSYFDNIMDITDFTPYHSAFLPFQNCTSEFEHSKLKIYDYDKYVLEKGYKKLQSDLKSEACIKGIIYNLCYTAACHALNKGCSCLYVYPSVSGKQYVESTASTWDNVITDLKNVFDIKIVNMIHSENVYLLYDGVVSLANSVGNFTDSLFINVEIGHMLTELTALSTDINDSKKLCAYSSFHFGGKNLLHQCVYDTLSHCDSVSSALNVLYNKNGENSLFVPKKRTKYYEVSELDIEQISLKLCKKFFPNNKRKGCPRDDSWHNILSEFLELVDFNTAYDFNAADIQSRANLIFRYALFIPVVSSFVYKALLISGNVHFRNIKIRFSGGSAKGFKVIDELTAETVCFTKRVESFLKNQFPQCSISKDDESNNSFMKSLSEIYFVTDSSDHPKLVTDNDLAEIQNSIENSESLESDINTLINVKDYEQLSRYCLDVIDYFISDKTMRNMLSNVFVNAKYSKTAEEISDAFSIKNGVVNIIGSISDVYSEQLESIFCMIEANKLLSECYGEEFSLTD